MGAVFALYYFVALISTLTFFMWEDEELSVGAILVAFFLCWALLPLIILFEAAEGELSKIIIWKRKA